MNSKLRKMLVTIMVVAMVATQIPMTAFAEADNVSGKTDEEIALAEQLNLEDLSGASIVESKSTESSTTYDLGNNEKMTILYGDAVRYHDENGDLVDYDPSLTEIKSNDTTSQDEDLDGYKYTNTSGDKKHYLPETLSEETPALMEFGEYGVSFAPTDSTAERILGDDVSLTLVNTATATAYEDVEMLPTKVEYSSKNSDSAIELVSLPRGLKENIVFGAKPARNVLEYTINLSGMIPKKDPVGNGISLCDKKTEKIVASIEAPFMNDATGNNFCYDVFYAIEPADTDGNYKLTVTFDQKYLNSKDTTYPVTVDPSITWRGDDSLRDVYVQDGDYADTNFYSSGIGVMPAGNDSLGQFRTFFMLSNLTNAVLGKSVSNAELTVYETENCSENQVMHLNRVIGSWSSLNLTWNNKPDIETTSISEFTTSGDDENINTASITSFVRDLASDTYSNYGLCMNNVSENASYAEFYGGRTSATYCRPKLVVTYYEKPTAANIIKLDKMYYKDEVGTTNDVVKVTYNGARSSILDSVNYKIENSNGASVKTGTLGNATGTYSIDYTSIASDGQYTLKVWGEDTNGNVGETDTETFYIDRTTPELGSITIIPATTPETPTLDTSPTITWGTITETNFSKIQYNINGGNYNDLNTTLESDNSGNYALPENSVTREGENTIKLKVIDKAGNTTVSNDLDYYLDHVVVIGDYLPDDMSLQSYYGKNLLHWDAPATIPESVYYKVYRSTTDDFTPSTNNMIAEDIKTPYFVDTTIGGTGTYYYKVKAIEKDTQGNEMTSNVVSSEVSGMQQGTSEFSPGIGSMYYLDHFSFDTPVGNGTIEKALGNFKYTQIDFSISNRNFDYGLERTYNSQSANLGMLGKGWLDSYHKEIYTDLDGKIYFRVGDGTTYTFTEGESGYVCDQTKEYELILLEDSEISAKYKITTKDNVHYEFNSFGQLLKTSEPNGSYLFYEYDSIGRLANVISNATEASGSEKYISFVYSTINPYLLQSITLPDDTVLSYTYSSGNQLVTAAHSSGGTPVQSLDYDFGYNTSGYLTSIEDGEGNEYGITYQGTKANRIDMPNDEYFSLEYGAPENGIKETTTSKKLGSQTFYTDTSALDSDTGKLLETINANGISTQYIYTLSSGDTCDNPFVVERTITSRSYETLSTNGLVGFALYPVIETITTSYNSNEDVVVEVASSADKTETTSYTYGESEVTENDPIRVITQINGNIESETSYEYNASGKLNTLSMHDGTTVNYVYKDGGLTVEQTVNKGSAQVEFNSTQYNVEGQVRQTSSLSGNISESISTEYDEMGRIAREIEEESGKITEYTYDFLGRVVAITSTIDNDTDVVTKSYDLNGSLVSATSKDGIITSCDYDYMNKIVSLETSGISQESGEDMTVDYGYDTNLSFPEELDCPNIEIAFTEEYTENNLLHWEIWYDGIGQKVKEQTGGVIVYYRYDETGNQVMTYVEGDASHEPRVAMNLFDEYGNNFATILNPEIDMSSNPVVYKVNDDPLDTTTDSILSKTIYYDDRNVKARIDGKGIITGYHYDYQNRISGVYQDATLSNDGNITGDNYTEISYPDQYRTRTVDANGNYSEMGVNEAGYIAKTKTGTGWSAIETNFYYDSRGNLIRENYADDSYKEYTYDEKNLVINICTYYGDNDLQTKASYTYDDNDRLEQEVDSKLDANGDMTPYHYVYYEYDGLGRLTSCSELNQTTIPETTDINSHKLTYAYDTIGNVSEINYPLASGDEVKGIKYSYNSAGQISTISAKIGIQEKTIRSYSYDCFGEVSDIVDHADFTGSGNETVERIYSYDNFGRVASMEYVDGDNNVLESFAYTYDPNSNITSEQDGNISKEYVYDDLGRLTEVTTTEGQSTNQVEYAYDAVGNRTTKTTDTTQVSYFYNSLNQLTSSTENEKDENGQYTQEISSSENYYDCKGNLTQHGEIEGSTETYVYNNYTVDSMLSDTEIMVDYETTSFQENSYNGDGQRVAKEENGTATNYFYQNGSVLYTTDSADAKTSQNFLTTEGSVISTARYGSNDISYYIYNKDIRNSTASILDEAGNIATKYSYDEFGQTTVDGSYTFSNEICYTGGIYDWATGQQYLNARFYDPETGRFMSEDTYRGTSEEPSTLNYYAYCANNPINYVDPSGHDSRSFYQQTTFYESKYYNKAEMLTLKAELEEIIKKFENPLLKYGIAGIGGEIAMFALKQAIPSLTMGAGGPFATPLLRIGGFLEGYGFLIPIITYGIFALGTSHAWAKWDEAKDAVVAKAALMNDDDRCFVTREYKLTYSQTSGGIRTQSVIPTYNLTIDAFAPL